MTTETIEIESAFAEVVALLLRLQSLHQQGLGDSPEADEVRDLMDGPWYQLTAEEDERARGISGDLFMLTGEEIFARVPAEQREHEWLGPRVEQAIGDADHWRLLTLLRHGHTFLPPEGLASMRAAAYLGVDLPQLAVLFYELAWKLTQRLALRCLTMLLHMELGAWQQALLHAREALSSGPTDPTEFLSAGLVLLQAAQLRRPEAPPDAIALADSAFREVLRRSRPDDPQAEDLRRDALMGLGFARQMVADGPPEFPDPVAARLFLNARERVLARAA